MTHLRSSTKAVFIAILASLLVLTPLSANAQPRDGGYPYIGSSDEAIRGVQITGPGHAGSLSTLLFPVYTKAGDIK